MWHSPPSNWGEALRDASADVSALTARLVQEARGDDAAVATLLVADTTGDGLVPLAHSGVSDGAARLARWLPAEGSVLWQVLLRGEALSWAQADPLEVRLEAERVLLVGLRSGVAVPLWARAPYGVLVVGWEDGAAPRQRALARLEELGRVGGLMLALARAEVDRGAYQGLLEGVVDASTDGIIAADLSGDLRLFNPAVQELVGWSREEVEQRGWPELVYPDPEYRRQMVAGIRARAAGYTETTHVEVTRADGATGVVRSWSRRMAAPGGETWLVGFLRDATDEHQERIERARADNLARLGRLAGGLAHEFNNLLGRVLGQAELILTHPACAAPLAARAESVVRAARRGGHLAAQLGALAGATGFRPTAVDSLELVRERCGQLGASLPGVDLQVLGDAGLPAAEADARLLGQALEVLVDNAVNAAGPGGRVWVRVHRGTFPEQAAFLAREAHPGRPSIAIAVKDSGSGFSDEALDHLFEPLWSDRPGRHGLGLAVVQGIVGLHVGAIEVRPGAGAEVVIHLPVSARPQTSSVGASSPRRGPTRVWTVDDEPDLLEFQRATLEAEGYVVEAFHDPRQVTTRCTLPSAPGPDLLVLDVVMPELTGPELLRLLRQCGLRDVPVVWSSGYTPERLDLALEPSMLWLQKPYGTRELVTAVADLLGRRNLARG